MGIYGTIKLHKGTEQCLLSEHVQLYDVIEPCGSV